MHFISKILLRHFTGLNFFFAGGAGNPCMGINLWNLYAAFLYHRTDASCLIPIDHTLQINKS